MKYFTLSDLENQLKGDFSAESIASAIESSTDSDLKAMYAHLVQPNAYLFLGWIEQWPELVEIITEGETAMPFRDRLKLQEHSLFPKFKTFVSPFLLPVFLNQIKNGTLNETLEYIVLLHNDDRSLIENEVFQLMEIELNKILQVANQNGVEEEQLVAAVHDVLNKQNLRILNSFSKRSYHHIVRFIEVILQVLNSQGCTFRLANWMLTQLQDLKLNPEHVSQLKEVKTDLKEGNLQLKTKISSTSLLKMKPWLTTILLAGFLAFVVFLIVKKPWSEIVEPTEIELASSLTELTLEERKHIDSLISVHQPPTFKIEFQGDEYYHEGREILVDARITNKNETVERYFSNWEDYLKQDSIRSIDACKKIANSDSHGLPDGFIKLKEKKNGQLSYIWNDSEYSIHFLVYNDVKGGKAYFREIKKGEEMEFLLSPDERLCFIAGNYSIKFDQDSNGLVFCHVDDVTFSTLMQVYKFKKQPSFYSKFVITGTNAATFQVVDVNRNLELIN